MYVGGGPAGGVGCGFLPWFGAYHLSWSLNYSCESYDNSLNYINKGKMSNISPDVLDQGGAGQRRDTGG